MPKKLTHEEFKEQLAIEHRDMESVQTLVNTLYEQASAKYKNISPDYILFKFDLNKLDSTFRFYYDINEPNGIYTKKSVPPDVIFDEVKIQAKTKPTIPDNQGF